jgi:chemotaxis receptor (MCP) glutamine deamidase CheD
VHGRMWPLVGPRGMVCETIMWPSGEIIVSYQVLRKRVVGVCLTMCMYDQKEIVLVVGGMRLVC